VIKKRKKIGLIPFSLKKGISPIKVAPLDEYGTYPLFVEGSVARRATA
jgi:hypothetical protein